MFTKKSIFRSFSILCLGMLILTSSNPAYAESSMDIKASPAANKTTMRDIVLVIDTTGRMAWETSGIGGGPDPGDDPAICNLANTCQPMQAIKSATIDFTNLLSFPTDRVGIVALTSQSPGGSRAPMIVLPLTSDKSAIQTALANLHVFQPPECPTASGPCLYRYEGTYKWYDCPIWRTNHDPSSCNSMDIGTSLKLAGNQFSQGTIRQDAQHIIVSLISGPAESSIDETGTYPNGFCPPSVWNTLGCRDAFSSTRHPKTDPNYDADDYARDMADLVENPATGLNTRVFTMGISYTIQLPDAPSDPPPGEELLKYIALTAGGENANHGNYFFIPSKYELPAAFQATANPVNIHPIISDITDKNTNEDTATGVIAFTISDVATSAAALTVTATSSNTVLVPNENIILVHNQGTF